MAHSLLVVSYDNSPATFLPVRALVRTSMRRHRLHPGYVYVADGKTLVWTLLTRGIVVCLWDERSHRGGMNHFLSPNSPDPARASPLFGDIALGLLLAKLLQVGSRREDLVAQIFSAKSSGESQESNLTKENWTVAQRILEQYEIPLKREMNDLDKKTCVTFDLRDGRVTVEEYSSGLLSVSSEAFAA